MEELVKERAVIDHVLKKTDGTEFVAVIQSHQ